AAAIDRGRLSGDAEARRRGHELASLLTPVAKAFSTDIGCEVASLGVQVHGGMGFVEETGAAQHLRDARIAPIYEGTNGIQAIDLVMRKLPLSDGATVRGAIADMRKVGARLVASRDEAFGASAARMREAVDALDDATSFLLKALAGNSSADVLAAATPSLRLFGIAQGGTALAKAALAASEARAAGDTNPAHAGRIALARFFAENIATGARGLAQTVMAGASALADAEAALAG